MTDRMNERPGSVDLERELAALLRRTGDSFAADPQALAEEGLRRGRARQFRQRLALVSGATAAVAVAVVFSQLPHGSQDGPGPVVAAAPESGTEMLDALAGLLPEDVQLTSPAAEGPATSAEPYVYAGLDGDGGHSFDVTFSITRAQTATWREEAGCLAESDPGWHCTDTELADGSVLTLSTTGPYSEAGRGPDSGASWEVWLESPVSGEGPRDQGIVRRHLSLTAIPPLGPEDQPPLSLDQMAEVVEAPVWQQVEEELQQRYGLPDPAQQAWTDDTSPEELRETFGTLLPERVLLGALKDRVPGTASFDILRSDGTGSATVVINSWAPGTFGRADRPEDDHFCELATTLPEGTEIFHCTKESSSDQEIYYDLYYPDGSSLDVTESLEAGDLPLNEEQLLQIVSDDGWRRLIGAPSLF